MFKSPISVEGSKPSTKPSTLYFLVLPSLLTYFLSILLRKSIKKSVWRVWRVWRVYFELYFLEWRNEKNERAF
jgi:hypothetical protein